MQSQALGLGWTFLIPSLSWEEIGQAQLQGTTCSTLLLPGTLIASRFSQKLLLFLRDNYGDGWEEQRASAGAVTAEWGSPAGQLCSGHTCGALDTSCHHHTEISKGTKGLSVFMQRELQKQADMTEMHH